MFGELSPRLRGWFNLQLASSGQVLSASPATPAGVAWVTSLLAANNLSDLTSASTARASLGLGTLATQSGTFSGTSSGTNTGDQTITLTGDVTGTGTGSFAATVGSNKVTAGKMSASATDVIFGRSTAGAGAGEEIACTATARSILDDTSTSAVRTTLGLGTSATVDTGTSGTKVALTDGANQWSAAQRFINSSGITILDTDASHTLGIVVGSNLTATRTLTLTPGDASRTITLSGDPTLVAGTMVPTTVTLTAAGIVTGGGDLSANRTVTVTAAVQSDMETGTSTTATVVPAVVKFAPGVAKAWVQFTVSGGVVTVQGQENVGSITRNGAGDFTINFTTAFSAATYAVSIMASVDTSGGSVLFGLFSSTTNPATGSCRVATVNVSGTVMDPKRCSLTFFGDQ
jgi:hypothetical protein